MLIFQHWDKLWIEKSLSPPPCKWQANCLPKDPITRISQVITNSTLGLEMQFSSKVLVSTRPWFWFLTLEKNEEKKERNKRKDADYSKKGSEEKRRRKERKDGWSAVAGCFSTAVCVSGLFSFKLHPPAPQPQPHCFNYDSSHTCIHMGCGNFLLPSLLLLIRWTGSLLLIY